jgi:nucleoside-diphosphate-sugar epimerase
MLVGVTGGTGFIGRYIINELTAQGHRCRAWHRDGSDLGGFDSDDIQWIEGTVNDPAATDALVDGVDAVVHCGVAWPKIGEPVSLFVERNVLGSVRLMEQATRAGAGRFVFISTCAVHEVIMHDRPLDEAHPLWPTNHYGAAKAAVEKFVHSFGLADPAFKVCALRPTGVYGLRRPPTRGRWVKVVHDVMRGKPIRTAAGGKEVHVADVAKAVALLLSTDADIAGQAYNCYDLYVAEQNVAKIAKQVTGSDSDIEMLNKGCKHQIDTSKIQSLGMTFGGQPQLEQYVRDLVSELG